jgi:hypothetical protein
MPAIGGIDQCSCLVGIHVRRIGSGIEKRADNVFITKVGCNHQRRTAVYGFRIGICAHFEQYLCDRKLPASGGEVQRRPAILVRNGNIRALRKAFPDRVWVALHYGVDQADIPLIDSVHFQPFKTIVSGHMAFDAWRQQHPQSLLISNALYS